LGQGRRKSGDGGVAAASRTRASCRPRSWPRRLC
jgi:hypothetical protein